MIFVGRLSQFKRKELRRSEKKVVTDKAMTSSLFSVLWRLTGRLVLRWKTGGPAGHM